MAQKFHGAKAAVLIGEKLLLYRRDAHVRWGGMWDMPGGGREGGESPRACLAREVHEEFALDVARADELWAAVFPAMVGEGASWFFVLRFSPAAEADIVFGEEGQEWRLFDLGEAMALPDLIAPLRDRVQMWLEHVAANK